MTTTFMNPITFSLDIASLPTLMAAELTSALAPTYAIQGASTNKKIDTTAYAVDAACEDFIAALKDRR